MNQRIRGLIILITFSFFSGYLYSQEYTRDYLRMMQNADDLLYFEENFQEAAKAYSELLKGDPDNNNLSYKLGVCYLNIPGKKSMALSLLKTAIKMVARNDQEYIEYGDKAPTETQFYLAHAFHLNDSLDQAIYNYTESKKRLGSSSAFRVDYINNQIKACQNAKIQLGKPAEVEFDFHIPWLKDYSPTGNPVIAGNDSIFIFTTINGESTRTLFAQYKDGWGKPIDITDQLGKFSNLVPNSITHDGNLLILSRTTETEGDLFYSIRTEKTWSKAKSMGSKINSPYWESFGFITADGKKLFFTSNREGGIGDLDIWISDCDEKGNWSDPKNAGRPVNSTFNETTPFFDKESGRLWFSSIGHEGIGDFDLYYSVFTNGRWAKPVSMPYPINTTGADVNIIPYKDNFNFISARHTPRENSQNIYLLSVKHDNTGNYVIASGRIELTDGAEADPVLAVVEIISGDSARIGEILKPDKEGLYSSSFDNQATKLKVSYAGYTSDTIDIPADIPGRAVTISASLIPKQVTNGEFLLLKSILFDFDSFILSEEGKLEIEKLRALMIENPSVRAEITGYTDSRGSNEYNLRLAARRVSSVVEDLRKREIASERFIIKAAGAKDFVAENRHPDGSDNPEGRKYNRRVTIGIINPGTGIVIRQPSFTPGHLRLAHTERYSIVLLRSAERYYPDYFNTLNISEFSFVRPVATDSLYYYLFGDFTDYDEALRALDFSVKNGFENAFIINQYDLTAVKRNQKPWDQGVTKEVEAQLYTIQLRASKVSATIVTSKLKGIKVVECADGLYRHIYGEYRGFSMARDAIAEVVDAGFKDAFIREIRSINAKTDSFPVNEHEIPRH